MESCLNFKPDKKKKLYLMENWSFSCNAIYALGKGKLNFILKDKLANKSKKDKLGK